MITEQEIKLAQKSLEFALEAGASMARIALTKSVSDMVDTLDGQIDKVSHCLDRALTVSLFVDGKYGSFSSNRLDEEGLKAFIQGAVNTVRILAEDPCRNLPDPSRKEKGAITGKELGLYDESYSTVTPEFRREKALAACVTSKLPEGDGWKLISEEGEYSDSEFDCIVIDSNGLWCRHCETSFEYGVEVTIEDAEGTRYSAYWWDAQPFLADLKEEGCGQRAVKEAVAKINPDTAGNVKTNMVIHTEVAGRMVTPLMNALGGFALQQNNSFLADSLGKQMFHEGLTISDEGRQTGKTGSRLFDSEGVAVPEDNIIENGVVKKYFINTYIASKMQIEPTVEDVTRAHVHSWPEAGLSCEDILGICGDGVLVTGFNGGNCNMATGDFSYGVEGFEFKDGKITKPVCGTLATGNFIDLWKHLVAVGDDARSCATRVIPTLAFSDVDFNG